MCALKCVVYASNTTYTFTPLMLKELAEGITWQNQLKQITGFLVFQSGQFFQYIEGDNITIDKCMDSIRHDERHHIFRHFSDGNLKKRRFAEWIMSLSYDIQDSTSIFQPLFINHLLMLNQRYSDISEWRYCIWKEMDKLSQLYQHTRLSNKNPMIKE
ncbi:MAG: BLUF domain-containing protein [Pseudomonadota bacterium]